MSFEQNESTDQEHSSSHQDSLTDLTHTVRHGICSATRSGSGRPVLLLHGVTRSWRDWIPVMARLPADWQLVAIDHPGHGDSARTPNQYQVIDYARSVRKFVDSEFDSPVTIVGHSLGAMVALWLAAECRNRISAVVLEDPPFHRMGQRIADTPYLSLFRGMQEIVLHGGTVEEMTEKLGALRLPADNGTVRLGDVRTRASLQFSAQCLRQLDLEVFAPLTAAAWLDGFEYDSLWSRLTCPVLLLQGDVSAGGAFTDADVALARKCAPLAQHLFFDGTGHQIHSNALDEFVVAVQQFVDREVIDD